MDCECESDELIKMEYSMNQSENNKNKTGQLRIGERKCEPHGCTGVGRLNVYVLFMV